MLDNQHHPEAFQVPERFISSGSSTNRKLVLSPSSDSLIPDQMDQAGLRTQSAPKSIHALKTLTARNRPWYVRRHAHFVSLAVMLLLYVIRYKANKC